MGTRSFKWFYRAHLIAGLFVSVHCLVLFLSGALLLFKNELSSLTEQNGLSSMAGDFSGTASFTPKADLYDTVLRDVRTRFPADRPLSFARDDENPRILQVRLGIDGSREFRGARRLMYDAVTGAEIRAPAREDGVFDWLLRLHRDLLMGANGKLYVGFVGLVFLFTLISGFLIYGNFMKKLSFGEIRRLTWRSFFSDAHKFVGVSLLFWGLLIGATGTLLAFNSTLLKIYQFTELRALNAKYAGPAAAGTESIDAVAAAALAAKPDGVVSFSAFPDTQFSLPGHFIVLLQGREGFAEKLLDLALVSPQGKLAELRGLPLYLKTLVLSEPLHFGDYGGLPLKILWLIFTLILLTMPISGLIVWVQRRQKARAEFTATGGSVRLRAPWNGPYLLPGLFFLILAGALTLALAGEGPVDAASSVIGLIPVLFLLAIFIRRGKKGP